MSKMPANWLGPQPYTKPEAPPLPSTIEILTKLEKRCTLLQQEMVEEKQAKHATEQRLRGLETDVAFLKQGISEGKHSQRVLEERLVALENEVSKSKNQRVLISPVEFWDACNVLKSDEERLILQAQTLQIQLAEKCNSCNYKNLNELSCLVEELNKVSKALRKVSDDLNKNPSITKVLKLAVEGEKKPSCTTEQFLERLQSPCNYLDVLLYQPEFAGDGGGAMSVRNEVITLA
eukprot:PhF_6_TR36176/c0_g3_i1/m.52705